MLDHCCNHEAIHSLLPGTILVTGILGSWHCVGMCGGLVVSVCETGKDQLRYHLGRLLGYLFLGTLSGTVGLGLSGYSQSGWVWIIKLALALLLIANGIWTLLGKTPHLSLSFLNLKFSKKIPLTPFWTGLGSIGLPCGWLYSIVLSLTLLQNPFQSALLMGCFWLGTLPALVASTSLLRLVSKQLYPYVPKVMGGLLILAGLMTLFSR